MFINSLMKILDKSQLTEERLHQSTNLSQANQDKELILSQLVQAQHQQQRRQHSHKFKVTVKVRPKLLQQGAMMMEEMAAMMTMNDY